MYTDHFGISENPFSIAPDPRYLFMSEGHREALAHLIYGMRGDSGFVLLTGEVGTGKTTICRCLLEQLPEGSNLAIIFNPKVTALELLATICDELSIEYPDNNASIKIFIDNINSFLLAANARGEKTVLIIDEAQNLETDVLEQVRLLTNLETNQHKLLQVIMLGQPELLKVLSRPNLRQLEQRITARYHLGPLSKQESESYVAHRLNVAGFNSQPFSRACIKKLYKLTGGVPRLINILCDRALLGTYVQGKNTVDRSTLSKAAQEVFGSTSEQRQRKMNTFQTILFGLLVFLVGGAALAAAFYKYELHRPITDSTPKVNGEGPPPNDGEMTALKSQAESPAVQNHTPIDPTVSDQKKSASQSKVLPGISSLHWPASQPKKLSQELGYKVLFDQWGALFTSEADGGNACDQAELFGLRCLQLRGSLKSLQELNRPAMLRLFDDQNEEYYATLTGIQDETAMLHLGAEPRRVALQDIAAQWFGHYILLWRPPPDYDEPVLPGYKGEIVHWLTQKLAAVSHQPIDHQENFIFSERLVKQLKKFQFDEMLTPDGVAGPQTLIHLNSALGLDVPTLVDRREDH